MNPAIQTPKKRKKKIFLGIALGILLLLIILRILLPSIVLRYVNNELNTLPNYNGHVDDIKIRLWRGAYKIEGVTLNKITNQVPVPFFSAKTVDLSVEWRALFHGAIVAKIIFLQPKINFVNGPTEASSQTKMDSGWITMVEKLFPLDINRVDIKDGEVHYMDFHSNPKIDIFLSQIEATATNLRNKEEKGKALPSTVVVYATCFNTGNLSIDVALDPLNPQPTFELKEKMKNVQLTSFSDFTEAYFKFKIIGGEMELYTEIAAINGAFDGYTKPLLHNLKIETNYKENKNIWHWLIANGTQFITNIFSNHSHQKQFATRIPLHGTFKKPTTDVWASIGGILKNAFIQALTPTLDSTLHITDVEKSEEEANK
jgi:hypothetical protein